MSWTINNIPDLSGKLILVTGGNSGTGLESVKILASKGARVVFTVRSHEKGENTKSLILKENPVALVEYRILELTDLESVREFSKNFQNEFNRLDVLLNNAGIMMSPYFQTKDGFEAQFGTNHLGHFALTGLLLDLLLKTPGSRVVSISSMAHRRGSMDFDNLQFEGGKGYGPLKAYSRSKLANLLFIYELQRKFEKASAKSMALAAHPGISDTNLGRFFEYKWYVKPFLPIYKSMVQDATMGSLPGIRAATDPAARGGDYYGPVGKGERKGYPAKVMSVEESHNKETAARLWEESEKLTGVRYIFR